MIVATDATDMAAYPSDFDAIHSKGIPHRAVSIEIKDRHERYYVCRRNNNKFRKDSRLEIPSGHVDWLSEEGRAESYKEAAVRELTEELHLCANWAPLSITEIVGRLTQNFKFIRKEINQIPSSHGNNNEWLSIFELPWADEWGNPCDFKLDTRSPQWLTIDEIKEYCIANPKDLSSSVRLFLRRRGILIPLVR